MLMTQRVLSHGNTGKRKGEVCVPTWEIGSDASSPRMGNQMEEPEESFRKLSMGRAALQIQSLEWGAGDANRVLT